MFVEMERSGEAPSVLTLRGGLVSEVSALIAEGGAYTPSENVRREIDELRASAPA